MGYKRIKNNHNKYLRGDRTRLYHLIKQSGNKRPKKAIGKYCQLSHSTISFPWWIWVTSTFILLGINPHSCCPYSNLFIMLNTFTIKYVLLERQKIIQCYLKIILFTKLFTIFVVLVKYHHNNTLLSVVSTSAFSYYAIIFSIIN